jgi:hypothetical protein
MPLGLQVYGTAKLIVLVFYPSHIFQINWPFLKNKLEPIHDRRVDISVSQTKEYCGTNSS